jgi:hypothetical protein
VTDDSTTTSIPVLQNEEQINLVPYFSKSRLQSLSLQTKCKGNYFMILGLGNNATTIAPTIESVLSSTSSTSFYSVPSSTLTPIMIEGPINNITSLQRNGENSTVFMFDPMFKHPLSTLKMHCIEYKVNGKLKPKCEVSYVYY